jgi:hypothetical protein
VNIVDISYIKYVHRIIEITDTNNHAHRILKIEGWTCLHCFMVLSSGTCGGSVKMA